MLECPPALGWCPPGALILRDLTRIGLGSLSTVLVLQNRAQLNLVGLVATLLESWIGADLQQRCSWLSNELVNAIQTLLAAVLAMLLAQGLGLV